MMYIDKKSKKISDEYLKNGYVVKDISDLNALDYISNKIHNSTNTNLKKNKIDFFNTFHKHISLKKLNETRLNIINEINKDKKIRECYFLISKEFLDILIGNEIAMQIRLNLSIQLPGDSSSLLPIHADTWSGDSPFEVVSWIPLVDCFKTKSMFILPPKYLKIIEKKFTQKKNLSSNDLYKAIESKLEWINIKYGQVLIFNQCLPHGNIVNNEKETRWSLNCRFKGLFTPYKDKKLGEFFEPITAKPVTISGMKYKYPF
jgi:sporadic carbohydrate cluster 2OG-Fe(II) oxygenase